MPGMSVNALDLSKLPPPAAVQTLSFEALVDDIKAELIERHPAIEDVLDLESEPIVKLLEAFAYREQILRNDLNLGHLAATLAYSHGADLDVAAANLLVFRLEGETDDEVFRARAVLAQEAQSTAGPEGAYRFHARSADPRVTDVGVSSPDEGRVRVVVLSSAPDGVADAGLLAIVDAALNKETIRPVTDHVEVVSAGVALYDVVATLRIPGGPDAGAVEAAAIAAVQAYAAAHRKLKRGITLAALTAALVRPGVEDLDLVSPAESILPDPETAPVLGEITLTIEILP